MIKLQVPATSANVGPGFDCLGLALQIYNTFEVERSSTLFLEGCEERYNNADNLFVKAYQRGMQELGIQDSIHATFHCEIPVSRGLGSSAAMICGGLLSASCTHENRLSRDRIFQLASEMEGHPDNVAPCIYGGLTASLKTNQAFEMYPLSIHDSWMYTVLIPDFEVSTSQARAILPSTIALKDAATNTSHAILMTQALASGSMELLKKTAVDLYHEPYRRQLIPYYEQVKRITTSDTDGVFLISGSGSTCLFVSQRPLSRVAKEEVATVPGNWKLKEVALDLHGSRLIEV